MPIPSSSHFVAKGFGMTEVDLVGPGASLACAIIAYTCVMTGTSYALDGRDVRDVRNLGAEESIADGSEHLLQNAGGVYAALADLGIDLSVIFKGDLNQTVAGGVDRRMTKLANLDIKFNLDGDKLLGWPGSSAFVYLLANHGGHPSEHAGDEQGADNIETGERIAKVYELWMQQVLIDGKLSLLLGMHDLNSEFYVTETSGLFLNSGFGVGTELAATGANGPSIFPIPAPSLRLKFEPTPSIYLQAAAFDT
jgi:carbohydrate-selective porin OprB